MSFSMAELDSTFFITLTAVCCTSFFLGSQIGKSPYPCSFVPDAHIVVEDFGEGDEERVEQVNDGDMASIRTSGQCKMVLIVRTDMKMSPGKISAHCGHATLACYKALSKANPKLVQHWERTGQAKIALKAKSDTQMRELEAVAKSLNLCARMVWEEESVNQTNVCTSTVLGIGPGPVDLINEVTGKLRLL